MSGLMLSNTMILSYEQPKYIKNLLKTAEARKLENERRIERQVQKEREQEGDMYADKESFVTAAYKEKLKERQEQEEAEKRKEMLEGKNYVRVRVPTGP